jgi:hypothetical protein
MLKSSRAFSRYNFEFKTDVSEIFLTSIIWAIHHIHPDDADLWNAVFELKLKWVIVREGF